MLVDCITVQARAVVMRPHLLGMLQAALAINVCMVLSCSSPNLRGSAFCEYRCDMHVRYRCIYLDAGTEVPVNACLMSAFTDIMSGASTKFRQNHTLDLYRSHMSEHGTTQGLSRVCTDWYRNVTQFRMTQCILSQYAGMTSQTGCPAYSSNRVDHSGQFTATTYGLHEVSLTYDFVPFTGTAKKRLVNGNADCLPSLVLYFVCESIDHDSCQHGHSDFAHQTRACVCKCCTCAVVLK